MAAPLKAGKQFVNLSAPGVRGSRIRRDPPPASKVKELTREQIREREQRRILVGVVAIATALAIITVGISSQYGASLEHFVIAI